MTAVESAFRGLREAISNGQLTAGQRLPAIAELATMLGVSRSSVREAISMLSALGVLEVRHGSGTFVSPLRSADLIGGLGLTIDLLPLDGVLEMYELRRVLESHASAQAAARVDEPLRQRLMHLLAAMEASTDPQQASDFDQQFHDAIVNAAGNPALSALLQLLRSRSRRYPLFETTLGPTIKEQSDREHRLIAEAIMAGDTALASSAAACHVAQTERWLRQLQPKATA